MTLTMKPKEVLARANSLGLYYVNREQAADFLEIVLRTLDKRDSDNSPDRTFPRGLYIGGRRNRKWLHCRLVEWRDAQTAFLDPLKVVQDLLEEDERLLVGQIQAAKILGVSRSTFGRILKANNLSVPFPPPQFCRKRKRWSLSDLIDWAESQ
jgi:predicted DNA-binding transcriptional regulator AlpA